MLSILSQTWKRKNQRSQFYPAWERLVPIYTPGSRWKEGAEKSMSFNSMKRIFVKKYVQARALSALYQLR
jgi:hypothetical protein